MAMNEEAFYASAGGARGNVVTDPNDLPRFIIETTAQLEIEGPLTALNWDASFYTAINRAGSIGNINLANTWIEIANVTGAGFLGNVIANHGAFTGSKQIGIRVEVDGVLWEWLDTITTTGLYGTLLLGALSRSAAGDGGVFPAANRSIETADAAPTSSPGLVSASFLMSAGAPVLAFRESLKVSVRNNRVSSSNNGQQAGCTYVLR